MDITENELLEEIVAALAVDETEHYDPAVHITYEVIMQRTGRGRGWASNHLNELARKGVLRKVSLILANGKSGVGFRR